MGTSSVVKYLEAYSSGRLSRMPSPRSAARTFRDLTAWQKAHEFVLAIYHLTESFPDREKYGLAHQNVSRRRFHSRQHCRGLRQTQSGREVSILKHRGRLSRRVPILSDPGP